MERAGVAIHGSGADSLIITGGVSMTRHLRVLIAFAAIVCFVYPAEAEPNITQAVSQDCRWDYHNFCSDYGIGSPLRRNGAKLSRACVNALIHAGDVSKAYVQARRRAG